MDKFVTVQLKQRESSKMYAYYASGIAKSWTSKYVKEKFVLPV